MAAKILAFSQGASQPTPSAQLAGFGKMSLSSQSELGSAGGGSARDKPPPPRFDDGAPPVPVSSQHLLPQPPPPLEIPLSQVDPLGTQDFITPVDHQFGLEYDPKDAKRSPARLTPNRVKRPRQAGGSAGDSSMEEVGELTEPRGGFAGPSGRGGAAHGWGAGAGGRRPLARVQSPPCYRNLFAEGDAEETYAAWKAPRPAQQALSRYRQDFREVGLLGQGNFSKVFRARHRLDGAEYAVKRSQRAARPDCPAFAQFIQEAQVLARLPPHPNIVQYYGCWAEPAGADGEHLYLQLEKCDVSLGIHASLGEQLREAELCEVARQLAAALAHCHRYGVAHLDVKPDNIYLQDVPEEEAGAGGAPLAPGAAPPVRYKLGDFGQATRLDGRSPVAVDEGDCRYMPQELLQGDLRHLAAADMFALGASLLELATRAELPSGGPQYADLRAGRLPLLPTCTQRFAAMIKALMAPKPEDRPSAEKLLASPLLAQRTQQPAPAASAPASAPAAAKPAAPASQAPAPATQAAVGGGGGGSKQFGGLVLSRSTAR